MHIYSVVPVSLCLLIHVLNNLYIIYSVAIRYSDIMYTNMTVEYFIHCYT